MRFVVFSLVILINLLKLTEQALTPLSLNKPKCEQTLTTVSGSHRPTNIICSGDLIFEDTFDEFDFQVWQHENTLAGGGNWEFQWYTNNRSNSFTDKGVLNIRPTLSSDIYGELFLTTGNLNVHGGAPADQCTNPSFYGCERTGSTANIINPIRSARIRTVDSFAFKYGRVEVSAKIPAGDWLWPAIWFMPKYNGYGSWPASGEIDLLESRGNRELVMNGVNIGVEQIGSTLHFGPYPALNGFPTSNFVRNSDIGFNNGFHRYQMEWSPEAIRFSVDDIETGSVPLGDGFWERGNFDTTAPGTENPWRFGTGMAPFDQEFYMIINVAVGGVGYFPDGAQNPGGKPWNNNSPTAAADFWNARNIWLPTWKLDENNGKEASLQVDYVRIWAL